MDRTIRSFQQNIFLPSQNCKSLNKFAKITKETHFTNQFQTYTDFEHLCFFKVSKTSHAIYFLCIYSATRFPRGRTWVGVAISITWSIWEEVQKISITGPELLETRPGPTIKSSPTSQLPNISSAVRRMVSDLFYANYFLLQRNLQNLECNLLINTVTKLVRKYYPLVKHYACFIPT